MKKTKILFTTLTILLACSPKQPEDIPFFNSPELFPEWLSPSDPKFERIHRIDSFLLYNQDSMPISNKNLDGYLYVANFFFTTCPSICPKMIDNMEVLQNLYKDDSNVKLVSHTVMPWVDTVGQLSDYASERSIISEKWHLLTGAEEEIYTLARKSYFVEGKIGYERESDEFLHTENFVLVDPKRRIRGIYNGTSETDIKRLVLDINTLLKL